MKEEKASKVRKMIKFDFENLVEKHKGHYRLKSGRKMLLSPTNLTKIISEYNMYPIPDFVLGKARDHGTEVMRILKECFDLRKEDPMDLAGSTNDKMTVRAIIDWLLEKHVRVLAVEKFITNGDFVGYIDMIVSDIRKGQLWIYEFKCRNDPKPRPTDIFQIQVYSRMLHYCKASLVVIDKDNKITETEINTWKVGKRYCGNAGLTTSYLKILKGLGMDIPQQIYPIQLGV